MELSFKLKEIRTLRKRLPLSELVKKGYKTLSAVLIAGLVLLGGVYIWFAGERQQKGYVLREQQEGIETWEYKNRELEKEVVKAKSLSEIKKLPVIEKMADPERIDYWRDEGGVSARR